jgi:hypothetical protein
MPTTSGFPPNQVTNPEKKRNSKIGLIAGIKGMISSLSGKS